MFCPTSFFSNWYIWIWFQKKIVGQNMNIWINTPPINVLVTAVYLSKRKVATDKILLKGITFHAYFLFFCLAFLQTSYEFVRIKTYKLHYFYILYTRRNNCHYKVFIRFALCICPCFKFIVYQIYFFALIHKLFPSTFIILVLFTVQNYRVSTMLALPWPETTDIINILIRCEFT